MPEIQNNLLDFSLLRSRLHNQTLTKTINVIFYSGTPSDILILNDNSDNLVSFLVDKRAAVECGETFVLNDVVLFCVGKYDLRNNLKSNTENKNLPSDFLWDLQNSIGLLFNYLLSYYNNHNINFIYSDQYIDIIKECYYAFVLASYSYDYMKKEKKVIDFNLTNKNPITNNSIELGHAQNIARFLGDTPSNMMTPEVFCEYAIKLFDQLKNKNITVKVLEEEALKEKDLNLLLSVGRGFNKSSKSTKLLSIEIKNSKSDTHSLALVGKGITFDSGGISLKPSLNMHRQKMDMMGGATMLMTTYLCGVFNYEINLSCTVCLAENGISGKATKPGDVIENGLKSVEINNTDAEGRLVLADGIKYSMSNYFNNSPPKFVMNACTLTGAMKVALGDVYGGYFTNSEIFTKIIDNAVGKTNDLLWRMPLHTFYHRQLKTDVADMSNINLVGRGLGGASTAAEFLHSFVKSSSSSLSSFTNWAHFDIAGIKDMSRLNNLFGVGATGRPVAAFIEIVRGVSEEVKKEE